LIKWRLRKMKKEIEKYTYRIEWSDYDRCHVVLITLLF
jgi:hypothetical protein